MACTSALSPEMSSSGPTTWRENATANLYTITADDRGCANLNVLVVAYDFYFIL
jgi:hypothetical protein